MLLLKLTLVPLFLLGLSLAARRWGAQVGGWLAGLPVVAGPILYFLAVEEGALFAAMASAFALGAIFASVAFGLVYARACQRFSWPVALAAALLAWTAAAWGLSELPASPWATASMALLALLGAPRLFPVGGTVAVGRSMPNVALGLRMLTGAALTMVVTMSAAKAGARWSGLLAVFPVLGIVLAVFSHRSHGPAYAAALLKGMAVGLVSFFAFCLSLTLLLPSLTVPVAFALATAMALWAQWSTRRLLRRADSPPASPASAS